MSTKSCLLRSTPRNHSPRRAKERSAFAILRRGNLMQLPEFTRSTTLRWTVLVAAIFAAFTVALLGFVYLKTKQDLTLRSDRAIALQMGILAALAARPEARCDQRRSEAGSSACSARRIVWCARRQDRRQSGKAAARSQDRRRGTERRGRQDRRNWPGATGGPADRANIARWQRAAGWTRCR